MSFLRELEKLSQPAPSLPDVEDENIDANNLAGTRFDEGDEEAAPTRRRIIGSSYQEDPKYAGEKVKRSDIFPPRITVDDSWQEDPDFVDIEDEEEPADDEQEAESDEEGSISEGELQEAMEREEEELSDEEEEGSGDEEVDEAAEDMKNIVLSSVDKDKESKKAESVRLQLKQWDQLLFLKIKLQAATRAFNQLPRGHLAKELMKNADEETKKNMMAARKNAKELVELLLQAEKALLGSSALTLSIVGIDGGMADSDDEEIESSEDEAEDGSDDEEAMDEEQEDEDEAEEDSPKAPESHSWKAQEARLKDSESKFDKFRTTTLVKWDERTRLTGPRRAKDAKKDFSAFEQGNVVQQIEKQMADKARILKRTQSKRSEHERIGGEPEADLDVEIFDDDDFYQILLKEMIDKKTTASQDPVAMTRNFIEMQKLRNKRSKKRVFDSRLSKDRKVKFVPIPKLVNFHPARPELVTWTHESRNELFKSLFK